MTTFLTDDARRFLEEHAYGVVCTVDPRNGTHEALAWYLLDGDEVVVNSAVGRRWPANLLRDPRISVVVSDGPRWLRLRGTAHSTTDQAIAQADIAAMARRYDPTGADESIAVFQTQQRISFRFTPAAIHLEI